MIRKKNQYSRPKKPFDKIRIEDENQLREKYGLKNKKEIWKADAAISRIRKLAKNLIVKSDEEKSAFIAKLQKQGFKVESLAEVLSLNKEDLLKRRLQTIVAQKGIANTPKQARQFIVHRHVTVNGKIVNIPSYMVELEEEATIQSDVVIKKVESKKDKFEELKEEVLSEEIPDEEVIKKLEEEIVL